MYDVHRCDRKFDACKLPRGGGVFLLVNKSYISTRIDLSDYYAILPTNIDILCVKLILYNRPLYVFICYIPPSTTLSHYNILFDFFSYNYLGILTKNILRNLQRPFKFDEWISNTTIKVILTHITYKFLVNQ